MSTHLLCNVKQRSAQQTVMARQPALTPSWQKDFTVPIPKLWTLTLSTTHDQSLVATAHPAAASKLLDAGGNTSRGLFSDPWRGGGDTEHMASHHLSHQIRSQMNSSFLGSYVCMHAYSATTYIYTWPLCDPCSSSDGHMGSNLISLLKPPPGAKVRSIPLGNAGSLDVSEFTSEHPR